MSNDFSFVSVIVPVFNDSERLKLCLTALENQTYPKEFYEIIVVDNNSVENIQSVTKEFVQVKLTYEKRPGSYAARNTGIAISRGSIFGFTDSDCIPDVNWIESGVKQLEANPSCGLVAGQIDFYFQKPDSPNAAELWDSLNFLQQKKYIEEEHFGATANIFVSKEIFDRVGLFNADLQSGGDKEWGKRVYAEGYEQIYAENVRIFHPARSDVQELNKKLCRVYQGDFHIKNQANMPLLKFIYEILLDLKPPIKYLIEILKNDDIKDVRKRISLIYIYMYLKISKALFKLRLYCA